MVGPKPQDQPARGIAGEVPMNPTSARVRFHRGVRLDRALVCATSLLFTACSTDSMLSGAQREQNNRFFPHQLTTQKNERKVLKTPVVPLTSKVNPFIGTGGHGHTYPGASMPFGMVQLSPDTRLHSGDWDGCGGYHYSDTRMFGFSHTHLSGTGVSDYADVLFAPITGDIRLSNGSDGAPGYGSLFLHTDEQAQPGYYSVLLKDYAVRAELTATARAGMHRYTYPDGKSARLIVDLVHRDEVLDSSLRFVSSNEIQGMRRSRSWASDEHVYFVARFSKPFTEYGIALQDQVRPGLDEARGKHLKAFVGFGDHPGTVIAKVGISAVSEEGARKNLEAEMPDWDFNSVRLDADAAWEQELSKIVVEGGTDNQQTIFYTALYHALLSPNTYMDVDGQYRGRDLQVHGSSGSTNYTVFSLWDTFRALHPLLSIIDRKRTSEFVNTFIRQYEQGGCLPVWELAGNETNCMIGYHAVSVIADAIMKDIGGFDQHKAFEATKHSADEDRRGLSAYKSVGYVPAEQESEGVSKTLEYAYDDWCVAIVAQKLGKQDDYERYMKRAQSYKNLFDPSTGFMRGRVEGLWWSPFDPFEVNANYTEANAWQYAFFAPQDMDGLIELHGSKGKFAAKLDSLFSAASTITGTSQPDITGTIGQYAQGNEPSHHMAYLYAFAGQPWKTQDTVRKILDEMYKNDPDGLIGNEDCGQMSAWFILSALGFYSVTPGANEYIIGAPLFPKSTVHLENGKNFVIRAPDTSSKSRYVQGITLNGVPYARSFLTHDAVNAGGEIVFNMAETPNPLWGTGPGNEPRTSIPDYQIVPVPFVVEGNPMFSGSTQVKLGDADSTADIYYSLDGTEPSVASSLRLDGSFVLDASTTVKAIAVRADKKQSLTLTAQFRKSPEGRTIVLGTSYSAQYPAGGEAALIDGLRGSTNWRVGRWQGYLGQDLDATVDLGKVQAIRKLAVGFLQDTGSWILMPTQVTFAISEDGIHFSDFDPVPNSVPDRDYQTVVRDFEATLRPSKARYVRVRAKNYGTLPAWHSGAGSPAWLFVDEITIE